MKPLSTYIIKGRQYCYFTAEVKADSALDAEQQLHDMAVDGVFSLEDVIIDDWDGLELDETACDYDEDYDEYHDDPYECQYQKGCKSCGESCVTCINMF